MFFRYVKPFIIWFYLPMLDYDVSLHILVVLVVTISTTQEHKKRSPDAKVTTVFVPGVLQLFSAAVVPVPVPPETPSGCIWR